MPIKNFIYLLFKRFVCDEEKEEIEEYTHKHIIAILHSNKFNVRVCLSVCASLALLLHIYIYIYRAHTRAQSRSEEKKRVCSWCSFYLYSNLMCDLLNFMLPLLSHCRFHTHKIIFLASSFFYMCVFWFLLLIYTHTHTLKM